MVKYALRENHLQDKKTYVAQIIEHQSYSMEDVIDLMADKGSTITKADIAAVMQVYTEVVERLISSGIAVQTRLFSSSFSISGAFEKPEEYYDPSKHTIKFNLHANPALRASATKVKLHKVTVPNNDPYIMKVFDTETEESNSILTKGEYIEVTGSLLKFDKTDPAQGVFLVHTDGTTTRCDKIGETLPSYARVRIPHDIESGSYLLEVRTMLNSNARPSKELKKKQFNKELTIQ